MRGSAFALPVASESQDLVTCAHVIEHLQEPLMALYELRRVCRHGGYVYLETPSQRSGLMPFGTGFWDDPTHVRPYSSRALGRLLEMAGLELHAAGTKRSLAAVILGLPYMFIGRLLGDPQAGTLFSGYAFGLYDYAVGRRI